MKIAQDVPYLYFRISISDCSIRYRNCGGGILYSAFCLLPSAFCLLPSVFWLILRLFCAILVEDICQCNNISMKNRRSQVDPSKIVSTDVAVVALVVQTSGCLDFGHTDIVIELVNEIYIADFMIHEHHTLLRRYRPRDYKKLMMSGDLDAKVRVKVLPVPEVTNGESENSIFSQKYGKYSSKSWSVPWHMAAKLLNRIKFDAEFRVGSSRFYPYYKYSLIGTLPGIIPVNKNKNAINCANWAVMMLAEAGITNQGGMLIDFPPTLTLSGTQSGWRLGALIGLGSIVALAALYLLMVCNRSPEGD